MWYHTKSMVKMVKKTALSGKDERGSEDAAWDAFVAHHAYSQFLQTSAWAELKSRFDWTATRAVTGEKCAPTGGASILLRRAAGVELAYVPRGPVVDWADIDAVQSVMEAVTAQCRKVGASVLLVEPELADSPQAQQLLQQLGLRRSLHPVQPPSTVMLDISGDEDAVLARMKSKWRYNVRLAQRKGVTVRELRRDELPTFYQMMVETGVRDGFGLHSNEYYTAAFDLFTPELGTFLLAEYEGMPLGALVVMQLGQMASVSYTHSEPTRH